MKFFIVDDDEAIRSMLSEIIEDYNLGEVVGEAANGVPISSSFLCTKKVDILIIDLLMPVKDGLQTISELDPSFKGKSIMLSQVENKEMIGKAYSLGVQYYITKPINRLEVIGVIKKVVEQIKIEKSISYIQDTLNFLKMDTLDNKNSSKSSKGILEYSEFILNQLGIIAESGSKDLLSIVEYLYTRENTKTIEKDFPSLKEIFTKISEKKLGQSSSSIDIKKEIKASEQRVRRAVLQSLNYIASLGLTDYSNPKFEEYAAEFFDFTEVRKKMLELKNNTPLSQPIHINVKKFIKVLYIKSKNYKSNDI
ncbi:MULTISPECIES: response regulator [Clostridium]|uniref:Stage 0 sporulation protein A homolog n=3 Tax=Clostridium TaxID=1485 RepID=D8GJH8_CLOLD|nr:MULTISPECIES: response regulator [Clostridium]ADK15139.1 predicted two-component response regulator [Clostridium ljungdahlii DSM 13528]AGY74397.1 response regulator [Clostridium autoethanogenum DSM 10061]ALU34584.1 Response regulator receiver protein [Clostridium autoethanogenum DSM 10061]OAA88616.1 Stage 0 sporulation protein A [Clostridium ljungdahlii DSM 13528]OAA95038.1 Stage 0 sporulation protein A [Clostridium coskatii]